MHCYKTILLLLALVPVGVFTSAASAEAAADNPPVADDDTAGALDWDDRQDFEFATRGLIDRPDRVVVKDDTGKPVWDTDWFADQGLDRPAPATVNPSLWRQARLNSQYGLYKVAERIYQVRGYDLSNLSIIVGDTGYIVVDPLITAEVAAAAMELVYRHLPRNPVVAVIYSHSHADHFGGVKGVASSDDVAAGKTRIIASSGFMEFAVSENVLAGNVLSRRAAYMFGSLLPKNEHGNVGVGLGKGISSGTVTLIPPTDIIAEDEVEMEIDGLTFQFVNTPFAEAPAEMMFYLPQLKAFYAAEEANATLHNLYTLRGAQVRDALLWSQYLQQAARTMPADVEVLFGGHHWPRWERGNIVDYLRLQADVYKYIHDQTLRLANHGYTMTEIAEQLELPDGIGKAWFNRGYYGSVNHNVKAVYQKYLGWFDGNPANLHPLPPEAAATRYVAFMGGADAVIAKARQAFDERDYRWVVEVTNHVIFADPENRDARELQAAAMEQLGYQAESGPWRNFYLTGASELRNGVVGGASPRTTSADMINALTIDRFFDYLAVRLNGPKAAAADIDLNFRFRDSGDDYAVAVRHGVLNYTANELHDDPAATVSLDRRGLIAMALLGTSPRDLVAAKQIEVDGDPQQLAAFFALLDSFEFWFDIVTP